MGYTGKFPPRIVFCKLPEMAQEQMGEVGRMLKSFPLYGLRVVSTAELRGSRDEQCSPATVSTKQKQVP